jgi:dienelactone hydrolase
MHSCRSLVRTFALFALAFALAALAPASRAQQDLTLHAADGVRIAATWYSAGSSAPVIVLFHQAGSNRFEYAPIAPRLVKAGFSCLAIDQRAGGRMWGHSNQTVQRLGHSASYTDALPDLEAALAWAVRRAPSHRAIVWGSSYSASLVFLLAAAHPSSVAAVLGFSPGEYFGDKRVSQAAARVTVSIFVTSAKDDEEIAAARAILAASPSKTRVQFLPAIAGVHGSSTLRSDRNPKGAAENWAAVLSFLHSLH